MASIIGKGMAFAANRAGERANVAVFQTKMEEALSNGLFEDALEAIKSALGATRTVRKRTDRGMEYEAVPDFAVQLSAAVVVAQYALGKPVNRTEMVVSNGASSPQQRAEDAARTLMEDPEAFIAVLDDWKAAADASKSTRKRVTPIEIPDEG